MPAYVWQVSDGLDFLPIFATNSGLSQDSRQESDADASLVRIWQTYSKGPTLHELVLRTRMRAGKSKRSQSSDKFAPTDISVSRHLSVLLCQPLNAVEL